MTSSPRLITLASRISAVGHPLVTSSLFILVVCLRSVPWPDAFLLAFSVLAAINLPVAVFTWIQIRRKKYSDFDVSDRRSRNGFYLFLLGVLGIAVLILILTGQPSDLTRGVGGFTLLMAVSAILNFRMKVSMHTGISFYFGVILTGWSWGAGIGFLVFAGLVGLSRRITGRHTGAEILLGMALGIAAGVGILLN